MRTPHVRAIWFEAGVASVRDDVPRVLPSEGEVRVRVTVAGVCATDLALRRGYLNFRGVPGHEFVGRALTGALSGRRVVGEINAGCGLCAECRTNDSRHCAERTVLGIVGRQGAFAEELCLPARNLREVPDEVPDEAAVFTEPLAAALAIGESVALRAGERALVLGDGKLGLLCAEVLSLAGLDVVLAGRHSERAAKLPEVEFVDVSRVALASQVEREFELAVEATGDADALAELARCVRPRGTIVLKTTSERRAALDLAPFVVDELRLVGSRCGRFEPALALLRSGRIDVRRWIDARYPLAQGELALDHAARRGILKVLIDLN